MSEFTLSLFEPNTLLPHRAGIAGLALALSEADEDDVPIEWNINDEVINLKWECSDKEAIESLMQITYQNKDGLLVAPSLNLSPQGQYAFSQGLLSTFLQHSKQRTLEKTPTPKSFSVDGEALEVNLEYHRLVDCYYLRELKGVFNSRGKFNQTISIKGHHLPGLIECFVTGEYQESPIGFISLLFLPLACSYYQLTSRRYALVIPEITNLNAWVDRRRQSGCRSYKDFRSPSASEAGLRLLLEESAIINLKQHKVDYCEVYQLGKQPWDNRQSGLKQAVYTICASDATLAIYQSAAVLFPSKWRVNDKGEPWLALSKVLPWIAENLVANRAWYCGFYEFRKANDIYERKGLVSMTENFLEPHEKKLFDAVQGAFSTYLYRQKKQAESQGRQLDYGQVTDKVIYRLQRPSTQQEFATALVDFLGQFRSKASVGVGKEIYAWIHGSEWRKARDLTLLAIATYQGKGIIPGKGKDKQPNNTNMEITATPQEPESEAEEYVESL